MYELRWRAALAALAVFLMAGPRAHAVVAIPMAGPSLATQDVQYVCGETWLQGDRGIYSKPAYRVVGRHIQPTPDKDTGVDRIVEIDGRCFILTTKTISTRTSTSARPGALYLWESRAARPFGGTSANVSKIVKAAGYTWMLNGGDEEDAGSLYRLEGDHLVSIATSLGSIVRDVKEVAGWPVLLTAIVADENGRKSTAPSAAYQITTGTARRLGPQDLSVSGVVNTTSGPLLVGHDSQGAAAFFVSTGRMIHLPGASVRPLGPPETSPAIGDLRGPNGEPHLVLFDSAGTQPTIVPVVGDRLSRFRVHLIRGQTFIADDDGHAWLREGQTLMPLNGPGVDEVSVTDAGGVTWMMTARKSGGPGRVYTIRGRAIAPFGPADLRVDKVYGAGPAWLLDPEHRVYEVQQGEAVLHQEIPPGINTIAQAGGCVWFLPKDTEPAKPAWRRCGAAKNATMFRLNQRIAGVFDAGGRVWLTTRVGKIDGIDLGPAFRVDEDVTMRAELRPLQSGWAKTLAGLGFNVFTSGETGVEAQYRKGGTDAAPYPDLKPKLFVAWASGRDKLNDKVEAEQFTPVSDARFDLSAGHNTIYLAVRDEWGNIGFVDPVSVWAMPGPLVTGLALPLLVILTITGLALAAPWSSYCNAVLMSPILRGIGTFGLIPLGVLLLPQVRRHLLRRYRREIAQDADIARWRTEFIPPEPRYIASEWLGLMGGRRAILLCGRSGSGKTTYFRYMTAVLSQSGTSASVPIVIPVFIPLKAYGADITSIEEMFLLELTKFGAISDPAIGRTMLERGGFLVLVDGLNEVGAAMRANLNTFVAKHGRNNWIIVSSQDKYDELNGVSDVSMPLLEPADARRLFALSLGEMQSHRALAGVGDTDLAIYATPQNVVLACRVIGSGGQLPRSELELFEAVFREAFDRWEVSGASNLRDILCRRAFEMMVGHEYDLNGASEEIPTPIQSWLFEARLVRNAQGMVLFQHDTIRDYLASLFLASNWSEVLSPVDARVTRAWLPALKLALTEIESPARRMGLLDRLLVLNAGAAGELFRAWREIGPAPPEPWSHGFLRRFGETQLQAA